MKIPVTIRISSLNTVIMLILLYCIVFVNLPCFPMYVTVKRILTFVLFLMMTAGPVLIPVKKSTAYIMLVYIICTLFSSFINEGIYSYSHPLVSGFFYSVSVIELFTVFSYAANTIGIYYTISVLYRLTMVFVLINDIFILISPFYFFRYGYYYFAGNKFSVCYKHIEWIVLFFMKNSLQNIKKPSCYFAVICFFVISLLVSIRVNCMTGTASIILLSVLLMPVSKAVIDKKAFAACLFVYSAVFPFVYGFIMNKNDINFLVTQIFHRNKGLTGRAVIYDILPEILRNHLLFGRGYNTAYEVWITSTNWYPNAQNGFWNCVCEQGLVAAALLSLFTVFSFGKNANKASYPLMAAISVYLFSGSVEITMDLAFIAWVILLYVIKGDYYGTSCRKCDSTRF